MKCLEDLGCRKFFPSVPTYVLFQNNCSNQPLHVKQLVIARNIKFLHVSAPGRRLQGILITEAYQHQHNDLGIAAIKC